jgi:hypothetical protein
MHKLTEKPKRRQAKKNKAKADKANVRAEEPKEEPTKEEPKAPTEKLTLDMFGDLKKEFPKDKQRKVYDKDTLDKWWTSIADKFTSTDAEDDVEGNPKEMSRLERLKTDGKGSEEPTEEPTEEPEQSDSDEGADDNPDHSTADNKSRGDGKVKDGEEGGTPSTDADTDALRAKLDKIHPLIDDMVIQVARKLKHKGNANNQVYSRRDVTDYRNDLKKTYDTTKTQFDKLKDSVAKYNSFWKGGGEKVADKIKANFPLLWTDRGKARAKANLKRNGDGDDSPLKTAEASMNSAHNDLTIVNGIIDALKGGNKGIDSKTIKDLVDLNADAFTKILDYFTAESPTLIEHTLSDETPIVEGIRSDVNKMWVVRKPITNCKPEELMSHSSFSNMYEMYGEGVTSDDIYGVYFDKTKATNIAKRLINKFNKTKVIEISDELIEEARKKKKKKKSSKATVKKKRTKASKSKRRILRRKSSFNNALARFYGTSTSGSDPDSPGSMGAGDGGGGE